MKAINRKLLRELLHLKGQLASIAVVVATGIMTVVTMRGTYEALVNAQESYYANTRFGDVWANLKRAPEAVRRKLETIPEVTAVHTRVTFFANLDLPGLDLPGQGRFVSVPARGRPILNDVVLTTGRYVSPGQRDEVIVSQNFAQARAYLPGDELRAVINGRARTLQIVGIGISPEHAYAVPPGALYPEDDRYGVLWMSRDVLGPAYDMDGAFNEVVLSVAPEADLERVITTVDEILEPYGGLGAFPRADQTSHLILQGELDSNRVMGTLIPAVFLAVAAFLLNMVLGRLIATQRTELAVLKAFGYSNWEVGWHYLGYALVAVAIGAVIGTASGVWLGGAFVDLYGAFFQFPGLEYQLRPTLVLIALGVSTIASAAGALGAVRGAVRLPPAEAMRPAPPARFEPGIFERAGLGRVLPSAGRMILRNLERQPWRSTLSALGVAFSVAILVIGMFMFDGVQYMMDLQFRVIQREDLTVSFDEPKAAAVRFELINLDGVTHVEPFRTIRARLRAGHREREVGVQGIAPDGRLRRIVTANGTVHPVTPDGLVLSEMLAEQLGVARGDTIWMELLEGARRAGPTFVSGVVDDFMGLSAYMSRPTLHRFAREPDVLSGAYLAVQEDRRGALNRRLKDLPAVAGVTSPASSLESFETQLAESLFIAVGALLGFASVISVAVIYNGARIALSERGRELASLRVMGFRRGEVATFLLGEQAIVTLLAIPIGWVMGYAMSFGVTIALQNETYRIPLIVSPRTYLLSAVVTIVAAAASALIVRRRIDTLDLIEVLKTRE